MVLFYVLFLVFLMLICVLTYPLKLDISKELWISIFAYELAMITSIILISKFKGGGFQKTFQLRSFDRRYILVLITSFCCTVVTSILINYFFSRITYSSKIYDYISIIDNLKKYQIMYFFLLVIIGPIFEEIIFRSVLLESFTNRYGRNIALVVTTILFGLIHFEPNKICYSFVLGLLACFITNGSKSLYPAIILHVIYNAYAFFFGIRVSKLIASKMEPISIIALVVMAVLFLVGTVQLKRKINLTTAST